ncbi:MAG: hypothetical protein AVDCRST_MAG78-544, partial [uncultured Rubrobacteraceae bacterium]
GRRGPDQRAAAQHRWDPGRRRHGAGDGPLRRRPPGGAAGDNPAREKGV